ncbi:hypothetical protein PVL29_013219 [Vitis rotundifolia]|uniref:Cation/H+ exchanger domain-containing protein n=1 Tax=Vitis rotundifolia TaxID=103349 RepID=A0AA39DQX4_VITRO|nr:hypothetical protein PVL29_013219 [Vitis rotundifolia]
MKKHHHTRGLPVCPPKEIGQPYLKGVWLRRRSWVVVALARGGGGGGGGGVEMANMTGDVASQTDATICLALDITNANSVWKAENPLVKSLPVFVRQVALTLLITRLLVFILKPLKQPRIMAEILVGMVLNPGILASIYNNMALKLFPYDSLAVLETLANVGLVFHVFLVGLEIDLSSVMTTGQRAFSIAISGIVVPLAVGSGCFLMLKDYQEGSFTFAGSVLWGLSVTVTGVHILTRVLATLKLLNTDLGKLAMSSAVINELFLWVILAVAIPIVNDIGTSCWAILATAAFVLFLIFFVRPAIVWMLSRYEGDSLSEFQVGLILFGVVLSAVATDACGSYSIIGAFVFGLVFPTGAQATEITEKLEDLVTGILVPLYYVTCGIRINLESLWDGDAMAKLMLVVALLCSAKVISTLLVYILYKMPIQEGIGLGLVLNTKDILALIILHIGRDRQAFDNKMFTVMVVAMLVMTGMVTPLIYFVYQPRTRFMRYKNRTIENSQSDGELRILTCLHQTRNVPGIISLLEASNPIPRSPLRVFALHLVELTGRASAMHIIHNTQNSGPSTTPANHRSAQAQSEQIISAFEDLEQRNLAVSVQSLTIMSPYATMDEDIGSIAEDKRVALTIIPFHKQQTADGQMEEGDAGVRRVNQNVLANASCSVAIFVDRGFGALDYQDRRICMLFFCGPDDREALSYSWRMAGHPTAMLAVIRFIPSENAADLQTLEEDVPGDSNGILSAISEYEKQKSLDDEFVENFRIRTSGDENILYTEVVLNNGEETVTAIREVDHNYDLYVVGRGQKVLSPLTAGLNEWSDCPELGAIGDILVTSEFASTASVLVIQQFEGAAGVTVSEPGSTDGSLNGGNMKGFKHSNWRQAEEDGGFDPFVRNRGVQHGWNA